MIIEDVTGESFASFMHREVTAPLGLGSLEWAWTRRLEDAAPTHYGELQEPVGYRQLGCQAVGSELCSVPEFARFVAAFAHGPHGEPAGRGVLKPETITQILEPFPKGLGFTISGDRLFAHFGGNPGWNAHFLIDATRREGFVVGNNSSLGLPFNIAVQKLWFKTSLGAEVGTDPPSPYMNPKDDPPPAEGEGIFSGTINKTGVKIAVVLGALLFTAGGWCGYQIAHGKRHAAWPHTRRSLPILAPPIVVTLLWWYAFYAPEIMPLPLGPPFLSIWTLPSFHYITALLLGWVGVAILFAVFPRIRRIVGEVAVA